MLAKVKVRGSPYRAVKPGVIGEVVGVKFRGTRQEHFKVRFKDGSMWSFYFDELEILDASKV